jgi:hypothetical protein
LIEKMLAEFGGVDRDFKPSEKEYALAIRLTGKFKTAFPEGKPGATPLDGTGRGRAGAGRGPQWIAEGIGEENSVVLVADSDILFDPVVARVQNLLGYRIVDPIERQFELWPEPGRVDGRRQQLHRGSQPGLAQPAVHGGAADGREGAGQLSQPDPAIGGERPGNPAAAERTAERQEHRPTVCAFSGATGTAHPVAPDRSPGEPGTEGCPAQLRQDVDSLQNWIKALNIAAMPLAVTLTGILAAVYKRKKTAAK